MVVDGVVILFKCTRHSQKHKGGYIAIGAGGSGKKSQFTKFHNHPMVMEFSRELTNLVFMNFNLITKHTNVSFKHIHILHATV